MRTCPRCGTGIKSLLRTDLLTMDEGGKMVKRKIERYSCGTCGNDFGVVKSRKEYLLVATKDVERMRSQLSIANVAKENLRKKVNELVREKRGLIESLKRAKESAYSKSLRSKLEGLEQQVEYLRKEKGRLEEHLARAG